MPRNSLVALTTSVVIVATEPTAAPPVPTMRLVLIKLGTVALNVGDVVIEASAVLRLVPPPPLSPVLTRDRYSGSRHTTTTIAGVDARSRVHRAPRGLSAHQQRLRSGPLGCHSTRIRNRSHSRGRKSLGDKMILSLGRIALTLSPGYCRQGSGGRFISGLAEFA